MIFTTRILLYSLMLAVCLGAILLMTGKWQPIANPAPLSQGHATVECDECHLGVNSSQAPLNASCRGCHDNVLGERRAHSTAYLDVVGRRDFPRHIQPDGCLDCHNGHVRAGDNFASAMPTDQCRLCHADLVKKDDYHQGLDFSTCVSCHQYHRRTLRPPMPRQAAPEY
ncbi:MAG: cytochrome c3 family protein [Marinobacter sp.]|nr:cytochrome c3 family protein [Marinobacter sp.]